MSEARKRTAQEVLEAIEAQAREDELDADLAEISATSDADLDRVVRESHGDPRALRTSLKNIALDLQWANSRGLPPEAMAAGFHELIVGKPVWVRWADGSDHAGTVKEPGEGGAWIEFSDGRVLWVWNNWVRPRY